MHRRKISEVSFTDSVAESFVSTGINSVFSAGSISTNFSLPTTDVVPADITNWDEGLKQIIERKKATVNEHPLQYTHELADLKIKYYHEFWGLTQDEISEFKDSQEEEYMRQSRMMEIFYHVKNIRFRMLMLTEFIDPVILSKLNIPNTDKIKIQISWMALSTIFDTFCINLKRIFDGQVLVNINSFISILGHSFNKLNKKYKDFSESTSILRDFIERGGITNQQMYDFNNQLKAKYNLSYNDSVDLSLLLKGYILTMLSKFHDPLLKLAKSLNSIEINDVVSMYKNIQLTIDFFSPQQSSLIISKVSKRDLRDSSSLYSINSSNHDRKIVFIKQGSWSKLWGGNYCQGKIVLFDNYLLLIESNENGEEKLSYPPMNLIDLDLDQDMHDAMFLQFRETISTYKSKEGDDFKLKVKNSNSNTFAFTNKITGLQIVGVFEELKLKFGRTGFQTMKLQQQITKVNLNKCYKLTKVEGTASVSDFHYVYELNQKTSLVVDETRICLLKDEKLKTLFETEHHFGKCDNINDNFIFVHNNDLFTLPLCEIIAKSTKWKLLDQHVEDFEVKTIDKAINLFVLKNNELQLNIIDDNFSQIKKRKTIQKNVQTIRSFDKFGIVFTRNDDPVPNVYLQDGTPILNYSNDVQKLLKHQSLIGIYFKPDQNQLLVGFQDYILTAYLKPSFHCDIFEDRILKLNFPISQLRFDVVQDILFVVSEDQKCLDVCEMDFNRDSKDVSYTEMIVCMRVGKIKFLNKENHLVYYNSTEREKLGSIFKLSIQ